MAKAKPSSMGIAEGAILMEKYRIESVLGSGGMGVVARAARLDGRGHVAIKFLRDDLVADDATMKRFLREAQLAASLQCEFVPRVSDVGIVEGDGAPFMVMEFLEGLDLGQLLGQRERLHPAFAVDLALQACVALAEAHSWGIVHRDIKPTNLFIIERAGGGSRLKVLDFGISKVVAGGDELSLTSTQSMLGTPAYMSPEQMRSARDVDARCDIWSLGTVLYEMVQGSRPFYAETYAEMCVRVIGDPPAPLTVALPTGLGSVILRCLEKRAANRYQTVADLAAALVPFAPDAARAQAMLAEIRANPAKREHSPRNTPVPGMAAMHVAAKLQRARVSDFREESTDIDTAALLDTGKPAAAPAAGASSTLVVRARRNSLRPPTRATLAARAPWLIGGALAAAAAGAGLVVLLGGGSERAAPAASVGSGGSAAVTAGSATSGGSAAAVTAGSATSDGSAAVAVGSGGSAAATGSAVAAGSGSGGSGKTGKTGKAGKTGKTGKGDPDKPPSAEDLLSGRGPVLPPKR